MCTFESKYSNMEQEKETYTVRPRKENKSYLYKKIKQEKRKLNAASYSNVIETILLNYFKNEPKSI